MASPLLYFFATGGTPSASGGLGGEGAYSITAVADGSPEALAIVPNQNGSRDEVWMIVKRDINGVTKRYVEYLDPTLNVDSGLSYSGSPAATFTGLTHLVGETVAIVGDGAVYPSQVVPGGGGPITIDPAASKVQMGLPYTPKLVTLPPEIDVGKGTSMGRKKRVSDVVVRLLNSVGLKINGERIPFRKASDPMGEPVPLFTGDVKKANLGWDALGQITIEQDQPLPVTVLAIATSVELSGD